MIGANSPDLNPGMRRSENLWIKSVLYSSDLFLKVVVNIDALLFINFIKLASFILIPPIKP